MIHFCVLVSRFFIIPFLSFLFLACSCSSDLLQEIQKRGYLVVSMLETNDSPFSLRKKNGEEMGVDVGLAKEIAKNLGVKLKILRSARTYDEVVEQIFHKKADLAISNLSVTLKRAEKVNYSKQYIVVKKAILLNYKTFSQLKKTDTETLRTFFRKNKLGVIKGSSYVDFAQTEFPEAQLIFYDDWDSLVQDLSQGVIAGGFWDQFEVEKIIFFQPHGFFRYHAVLLKVPTDKVAIAVQKSNPDFLTWINTFLELKIKKYTITDLLNLYKEYNRSTGEES